MLTAKRARELLIYDRLTGWLIWRVSRGGATVAGTVAGTPSGPRRARYIRIKIDGIFYWAHNVAWLIVVGTWPRPELDHKDRNGLNNVWRNLRQATRAQNQASKRLQRNNKSGFKGVYWNREKGLWRAECYNNGKNVYLGDFVDKAEAVAVRKAAAATLYGEFADG